MCGGGPSPSFPLPGVVRGTAERVPPGSLSGRRGSTSRSGSVQKRPIRPVYKSLGRTRCVFVVVGKGRLELPRLAAQDPKSCSSTNSDTSPAVNCYGGTAVPKRMVVSRPPAVRTAHRFMLPNPSGGVKCAHDGWRPELQPVSIGGGSIGPGARRFAPAPSPREWGGRPAPADALCHADRSGGPTWRPWFPDRTHCRDWAG